MADRRLKVRTDSTSIDTSDRLLHLGVEHPLWPLPQIWVVWSQWSEGDSIHLCKRKTAPIASRKRLADLVWNKTAWRRWATVKWGGSEVAGGDALLPMQHGWIRYLKFFWNKILPKYENYEFNYLVIWLWNCDEDSIKTMLWNTTRKHVFLEWKRGGHHTEKNESSVQSFTHHCSSSKDYPSTNMSVSLELFALQVSF